MSIWNRRTIPMSGYCARSLDGMQSTTLQFGQYVIWGTYHVLVTGTRCATLHAGCLLSPALNPQPQIPTRFPGNAKLGSSGNVGGLPELVGSFSGPDPLSDWGLGVGRKRAGERFQPPPREMPEVSFGGFIYPSQFKRKRCHSVAAPRCRSVVCTAYFSRGQPCAVLTHLP